MKAKDVVKELFTLEEGGVVVFKSPEDAWGHIGKRYEEHVRDQVQIRFRGNPRPEWDCLAALMKETMVWATAVVRNAAKAGVKFPVTANVAQFERVYEHATGFTVSHKPKDAEKPAAASHSAHQQTDASGAYHHLAEHQIRAMKQPACEPQRMRRHNARGQRG